MISDVKKGAFLYRRKPWLGREWGGPMNGQGGRCRLISELILKGTPVAIVETGTYLGTTTEWLSGFQLPVLSCEVSHRNFGFSQRRLIETKNVKLILGDSRSARRGMLAGPLLTFQDETILFYLDAHWGDDLPLAEELDIIFSLCAKAIVIVDDFQVPDDPGYSYDDYGPGKSLTIEYARGAMERHELKIHYPSIRSEDETGAKRGCAVFAKKPVAEFLLGQVTLLRRLDN